MPVLWLLQQSAEGLKTYFDLADRGGSGTLIANFVEVLGRTGGADAPRPLPRLVIDDDAIALDLFVDGLTFVSERLVEAMDLPPGAVALGDIDDDGCSPAVRRMRYRTLDVLARGDAIDPAASDGEVVNWVDEHGAARSEWLLAAPQPNRPAPKVRWRADFTPPAELFAVNGTSWRAATDALAARVMRIGPVGLSFVDPIASAATGELVARAG